LFVTPLTYSEILPHRVMQGVLGLHKRGMEKQSATVSL